jgi:flavin reductase (DIM6/NTAB) family NADH-FMN oxidoreductase RutF
MTDLRDTFVGLTLALDYPMHIVTTADGDERSGCLVGFTTQCSIDPPRYLVCLSDKNHTTRVAAQATALAVHFVPPSARDLAELFGAETEDTTDKFERCDWHPGPEGLPLLTDCKRWFAGRILERRRLGDHIGHLLEPFAAADDDSDKELLMFSEVKSIDPGHAP